MLNKLKELREDHEDGFTLIELLVVILIIGILASIAIPVFLNQRKTANDGAVKSDVRNAALVIETLLISNSDATKVLASGTGVSSTSGILCVGPATITGCAAIGATPTTLLGESQAVKISNGVALGASGDPNSLAGYTITGYHVNGNKYTSGSTLKYISNSGGLTN